MFTFFALCVRALAAHEVSRGRRPGGDERVLRNLSVQRRLGESNDLQHEASRLISQSEMRIHRIGEVILAGFLIITIIGIIFTFYFYFSLRWWRNWIRALENLHPFRQTKQ